MNRLRMGPWIALLASAPMTGSVGAAPADESPYTSLTSRDIKALSATAVEDLLAGRGMGLALAAELNGYPGPKHVLELADELELTDEQLRRTRAVYDDMAARASELGREIVAAERRLDRSFTAGDLEAVELATRVEEIGRLNGRLRAVHLSAHLAMMEILSESQRASYVELRGYGDDAGPSSHPHGGPHQRHHGHPGEHGTEGAER